MDVVIVGAARTAVGTFLGSLGTVPAHKLGAIAIAGALARAEVEPNDVDEVIMGQVLTAGTGQNPARQAAVAAGIPHSATAFGINLVCGSGLRAVALAAQGIREGDALTVVAGGQESMSLAPHCQVLRAGAKMGSVSFADTLLADGLTDAFGAYHMGRTAENVAQIYGISREEQDRFATGSHGKASMAQREGRFNSEIASVAVEDRNGTRNVDKDEHIRHDASETKLAALKPAFQQFGTVTAGNSSGINDGAAALVMMSATTASSRGRRPLARIAGFSVTGVDPAIMGIGPISASKNALTKAGWRAEELDLIEANEAFAAQACAVNKAMGWDPAKVNVNGGAIALGHPIGASGARILVTLLHEMGRRRAHKGLATLCIGGGMGVAMCLELL